MLLDFYIYSVILDFSHYMTKDKDLDMLPDTSQVPRNFPNAKYNYFEWKTVISF